jgi:hypothetical protein
LQKPANYCRNSQFNLSNLAKTFIIREVMRTELRENAGMERGTKETKETGDKGDRRQRRQETKETGRGQ